MEIADRVSDLTAKIRDLKDSIETEEATKNAFVMPFISSVLGFDVFNPSEVIPEFTADVGTKKGEKIDYALVQDGKIQILIEVKKVREPLKPEHASQLFRYFATTHARVAILTNGQVYEFYTDLDAPNRMDERPYLVLDLSAVDQTLLPELKKLTRESFDLTSVLSAAGELKYIGQIRRLLSSEFRSPSEEFVRFLASRVYTGKSYTQRVRDQFEPLVSKALAQFLSEQVNERLKNALGSEQLGPAPIREIPVAEPAAEETAVPELLSDADQKNNEVETTEEEMEAFRIVRAIACSEVAVERVVGRDSKTYFAVLLDNNNRRPVARLWMNRSKKYVGLFDKEKNETRHAIEGPVGIYSHAAAIRETVRGYL